MEENLEPIQQLFDKFKVDNQLTVDSASKLLKDANIEFKEARVKLIFGESLATRIDTMNPRSDGLMSFAEFLVFLCTVAYEPIRNDNRKESLTSELTKVIKAVLESHDLEPLFGKISTPVDDKGAQNLEIAADVALDE